jgi:hypothetical protein
MVTLADLGFSKGVIYESIVCTYNSEGVLNAAPMGVVMQEPLQVVLTIYNSACTLKNLQHSMVATLNFTDSLDVFFQTALKEAVLPLEWFEKSDKVNAPQLKQAHATIAVNIQNFLPLDTYRTRVICNVLQVHAVKSYPQSYCRAKPAVLEAIIHATRIKELSHIEEEQGHVDRLVNLIQNCHDVVNRSAPKSPYAEMMLALQKKVDSWRT